MRSVPIRLTKFESGLLLNYLDTEINQCLEIINEGSMDKNSFEFRLVNLYDLKKKLVTAYKKLEYQPSYSRDEACDDGDM